MKCSINRIIMWCIVVGAIALIGFCVYGLCRGASDPVELAKYSLEQTLEKPESVKFLKVSKPIPVMGKVAVTDREMTYIRNRMMAFSDKLFKSMKGNPEEDAMVEGFMGMQSAALMTIANMNPKYDTDTSVQTGWKVKLEYTATTGNGKPVHSEYWVFLDKDCRVVLNCIEIPLL